MKTLPFWIDHFAAPDPQVHRAFTALTPNDCAEALDIIGAPLTHAVQYESPENRVFGFGDVVLKFYRPGRWTLAALQDELQFLEDLRDADVPFVRPIGGVGTWRGIHYLAYEAVQGPFDVEPDTLDEASVHKMVHTAARIHDVGARRDAPSRPAFDPDGMCWGCFEVICNAGLLPKALEQRYAATIEHLLVQIAALGDIPAQHMHGDCTSNNALWRQDGPVFLDLDDFRMGPVVVDVTLLSFPWRLESLPATMDRRERRRIQHQLVRDIYRQYRAFPDHWEAFIPLLRACRDIMFDAWLSCRWTEPGFAAHYDDDDLTDPDWWRDSIEGLERCAGI